MNGTILERTTTPLCIQLAERDYYGRKSETRTSLPSPALECESPHDPILNHVIITNPIPASYTPPPVFFDPSLYVMAHAAGPSMSQSVESVLQVSGLSPTVTVLQLCTVFARYGQILGIRLNTTSVGPHCLCSGTAIIRLYGPIQHRDNAYNCLNGAHLFPFDGPIFITTI
jgi:hypothetical protein